MTLFGNLKQNIKRRIAEAKEAHKAYKEARHEEKLRVQHLKMQKKLEHKKSRIARAKEAGVKSVHVKHIALEKSKSGLKSIIEKAKKASQDPAVQQLLAKAKQEAKRSIVRRPHRKRKHMKHRKRGY